MRAETKIGGHGSTRSRGDAVTHGADSGSTVGRRSRPTGAGDRIEQMNAF